MSIRNSLALAILSGLPAESARLRLFTTFPDAKAALTDHEGALDVVELDRTRPYRSAAAAYHRSQANDIFLFNGETGLISLACMMKWLLPGRRGRIVAADMVLRRPRGKRRRLLAALRKRLWRQVELFIHYFRDLSGYEKYYGIGPARSAYVPFKSNILREALAEQDAFSPPASDYIFSAGRSLRDYTTLIEAARLCGLPVAILFTGLDDWAAHGTHVELDDLPDNVRLIPDQGGTQGWIDGLRHARIVAIPTLPESLCASGIGTYLDAMALGKPVVITRGPGADDVLYTDQAVFVPPSDPHALARELNRLWEDRARCTALGTRGRAYALALGDARSLLGRIVDKTLERLASGQPNPEPGDNDAYTAAPTPRDGLDDAA